MNAVAEPASLQEQKRAFTKARLIEAALKVFSSHGYEAAKADDIARAAGCSRATFYLHFSCKSAVMIGLLEGVWPNIVEQAREFAQSVQAGMTKDELRTRLADHLALWRRTPGSMAAVNVAMLIDPGVAEWYTKNSTKALDVLAGLGGRRSAADHRQHRARIAILSRMTLAAFSSGDAGESTAASPDAIADYLADLWADLLMD